MALKDDLKKFSEVFGRDSVDIGSISYKESKVDLNDDLESMYNFLQFEKVITVGGEMFINIMPKDRLESAQQGWYLIKEGDSWIQDDKKWNKKWIVFANRNDDAIFFDETDGSVKATIDKKLFFKLSDSLSKFFRILSACMELEKDKYNFETRNIDEEVSEAFINDVLTILDNEQADQYQDEFREFFFE